MAVEFRSMVATALDGADVMRDVLARLRAILLLHLQVLAADSHLNELTLSERHAERGAAGHGRIEFVVAPHSATDTELHRRSRNHTAPSCDLVVGFRDEPQRSWVLDAARAVRAVGWPRCC